MRREEFYDFLFESIDYLIEKQEELKSYYGLSLYERWHYDQETGIFTFSSQEKIKLRIKYQEVGSFSKRTRTWKWSWNNKLTLLNIKDQILAVREFGEQHGISELKTGTWEANELDGWEMTAVAARILNAKGAYRAPVNDLYVFMLFMEIEQVR